MSSQDCDCCGPTAESSADSERAGVEASGSLPVERAEAPLAELELPDDLQRSAQVLFASDDPVETLGGFVDELHAEFDAELPFDLDTLCTTDEAETWGETGGERHHFLCVQDALMLPAVLDGDLAEVRTVSPVSGTEIRATVTTEGIEVTPADAVLSFGTSTDPDRGISTTEAAYANVCPYVRAFPSAGEYETWQAETDAATVAIPFQRGFDLTHELVNP